jgi:N-methylhydantoinase A
MGGTSTDVALIDGQIRLTSEGRLGEYPVAVPMVDMHTIGAGGGSLAYLDEAGLLHVGPESAGADPGPACYGRGGRRATVTDANLVLGRLRADNFLGGAMALQISEARQSLQSLADPLHSSIEEVAKGILALANEHMIRALRVISVQKGYDPADFVLCCFGGAGGLHVCSLAEELGISQIVVPLNGGVLSAFGMLVAPRQRNLVKTVLANLSQVLLSDIIALKADLVAQGRAQLEDEGLTLATVTELASLDCRYQGQSFCLAVPFEDEQPLHSLTESFHHAHQKTYGHRLDLPVELVNVRVQVQVPTVKFGCSSFAIKDADLSETETELLSFMGKTRIYQRDNLGVGVEIDGPCIVCETVSTTLILMGWAAKQDEYGHLRAWRKQN